MKNVTGILLLALVAELPSLEARKPQGETDADVSIGFLNGRRSRDPRLLR